MADGDFNLATLWVPVVPETSQVGPKIEEAGDEAKRRWTDKVKDFGHTISDDLEKVSSKAKDTFGGLGTHISDVFSKSGKDSADKFTAELSSGSGGKLKDLGHQFGEAFGSELGQAVGGALRDKFPIVDQLATSFKGVGSAIDHIKQADLGGALGDASSVLHGLEPIAKSFGIDISSWPDSLQKIVSPAQNAMSTFAEMKTNVQGVQSLFGDFKKDAPGIAGSFTMIAEAAGPVAALMGTIVELWPQIKANMDYDNHKTPSGGVDWWKLGVGNAAGGWLENQYNQIIHGHPTPTGAAPPGAPLPQLLPPLPPDMAPGGAGGSGYDSLFGGGSGIGGAGAAFSGDTLPSAARPVRDVGSDKGLTATSAEVKRVVSTMFPQINDIGGWRPPDGYNEHSSGHALDVMIPNAGTPQGQALGTQIKNYVLQHSKELGVDYALWQQTQWNPGGTSSPMENHGDPNQNHFTHVHIHTAGSGSGDLSDLAPPGALGSGGGGFGSSGGGMGPIGTSNDPIYTASAADAGTGGSGGAGGGGGQGNSQAEQLGKGLVNGVLQEFGLDGSVFKGFGGASNPLQFGSVKAGMGLLNFGLGLAHSQGAGGMGGVGGGGGIPGMIPTGPGGGAQNVNTGAGDVTNNYYHGPVGGLTVNQQGVQSPTSELQNLGNSGRAPGLMAPNGGGVPPGPSG